MRCYDCTDFLLPVVKSVLVSIVKRASERTLPKKEGTIGWIANEKLQGRN